MKNRSLTITPEILSLIACIDEFKGGWKKTDALSEERLSSLRRLATIESIGSSTRIEGASLSDSDVEKLLGRVGGTIYQSRDEEEVAGYASAMETIYESYADIPLSENYVKQLHKILLQYSIKDERHRGEYKTVENNIEAFDEAAKSLGVILKTATPFDTPRMMKELLAWTNDSLQDNSLHPLLVIGVFTVELLGIHPFNDGNGRLSRILTTHILLKAGYTYTQYASLESLIEKSKDSYYLNLRRTQATLQEKNPEYGPWLVFFLRVLKKQVVHLESKMKGIGMESEEARGLHPDAKRILQRVREKGSITISEAHSFLDIPRPTVKVRLRELLDAGLLMRQGKGRGSWYELHTR